MLNDQAVQDIERDVARMVLNIQEDQKIEVKPAFKQPNTDAKENKKTV